MAEDKKKTKEIQFIIQAAALAIPKEREARDRYLNAARRAPGELSREIFSQLAAQEDQHEKQLRALIQRMEELLLSQEQG